MKNSLKKLYILTLIPFLVSMQAYYTSCVQDLNRVCPNSDNQTDFLLTMKKGGTDILSTDTYMYDFMLCEQFNYDCGYQENFDSYTTCSNGVQLTMNQTQLLEIFQGTNLTLSDKLTPYLQSQGQQARCGMRMFPLTLTPVESKSFLDLFMADLQSQVITLYDSQRDTLTTSNWPLLNINIRTAVLFMLKKYDSWIGSGKMWDYLVVNNFTGVSSEIKKSYQNSGVRRLLQATQSLQQLHASYLVDSVTVQCDKRQSINFLVDQSGSIGQFNFQTYVRQFLQLYINTTNDDLSIVSLHYYSNIFQQFLGYGNDYDTFLTSIQNKIHPGGGTLTGNGINETITRIQTGNFLNGLPKIMAVMTDGFSHDDVFYASEYARSLGITMIAIGVGSNVDDSQLLQIAQTSSNIVKIDSYDKIGQAVQFLFNFFCKQLITINLGDSIQGNYVKVPTSPSYFRVVKSTQEQYYFLEIDFEDDPQTHQQETVESQVDPFPDQYTEYDNSQNYQVYSINPNALRDDRSIVKSTPKKVYFIEPENVIQVNVKKNIFIDFNASISYVAIRGVELGFNISLRNCTTLTCQDQRALYRQQQSQLNVLIPNDDLSIFIIIGSVLGGLLCCSILIIFGIRRWQQQQKKKKKLQQVNTQSNLQQNIVPVPANTGSKMKQEIKNSKQQKKSQIQSYSRSSKSSQYS